ncbi:hypothetical protein [Aquimarina sp. MMG016]|uniref:hypothetical protein n=1 Tax=Aquimarina sp. MMG016 TaxID=2822690 RepID=UPI001B3A4724|nr:hypothetical protein [Aquimarina sp. MMG016]MBQ4819618.1 hypothetical protein [Aquimarina sp. MMG016]
MKKLILIFLLFLAYYQIHSQSKETALYMRKELVKQRDDLIKKAERIQRRIDSIDRKLGSNKSSKQYLTKSVNYDSETNYSNSLESNTTRKKRYKPRTTKTYYRGPRGGCYYINSNGNKTYVSKSMCN